MKVLRDSGMSYGQVAKVFGISRQRVHQLISGYPANHVTRENGWYGKLRELVLLRENHRCSRCGSEDKPIVHHIDGDNRNNQLDNLTVLCRCCHQSIHRPRIDPKGIPTQWKLLDSKLAAREYFETLQSTGGVDMARRRLLRMREASEILRVHSNTLRRWSEQGLIPCQRIGNRGDRRYLESDVWKFAGIEPDKE